MLLALALSSAPVDSAERAFAAKAQRDGQWTAFRAFAADDGVTFAPAMVNAQKLLGPLKDPATAIMWWPARSISACDGSLAISTGPWINKAEHGTFTTVWQRQPDGGWKWLLDHGRNTPSRVSAGDAVKTSRASCVRIMRPPVPQVEKGATSVARLLDGAGDDVLVQLEDRMPAGRDAADLTFTLGERINGGASQDGTLVWEVRAIDGADKGAHMLLVRRFDGHGWPIALLEVTGVKRT